MWNLPNQLSFAQGYSSSPLKGLRIHKVELRVEAEASRGLRPISRAQ
jgi:hypothetical protein